MLDDIKELQEKVFEQKVEEVNILFLDISATCTGYSIASINFVTKKAKFIGAGCIWLPTKWSHQEKYSYMFHAICNYFWIVEKTDYIVVEQYSVNPKKMSGVNVVSEMQGAIKCAAWENAVKVDSILPQTWRSILKIKPIITAGKRNYKTPTKDKVLLSVDVPEISTSNITAQQRTTPSDVYDALAIGMAWLIRLGFTLDFTGIEFNKHVGILEKEV